VHVKLADRNGRPFVTKTKSSIFSLISSVTIAKRYTLIVVAALHRGVVRLHYGIVGLQYGVVNGQMLLCEVASGLRSRFGGVGSLRSARRRVSRFF